MYVIGANRNVFACFRSDSLINTKLLPLLAKNRALVLMFVDDYEMLCQCHMESGLFINYTYCLFFFFVVFVSIPSLLLLKTIIPKN
eukprot:UN11632